MITAMRDQSCSTEERTAERELTPEELADLEYLKGADAAILRARDRA